MKSRFVESHNRMRHICRKHSNSFGDRHSLQVPKCNEVSWLNRAKNMSSYNIGTKLDTFFKVSNVFKEDV